MVRESENRVTSMKRLDLKLAAKDWSPSSSQPPSLSSAPGSAAARTLLKLENDDWTEDELAQVESIPMAQTPRGSEVDLALVAQMMKTTVRKRSPRVRSTHSMPLFTAPLPTKAPAPL